MSQKLKRLPNRVETKNFASERTEKVLEKFGKTGSVTGNDGEEERDVLDRKFLLDGMKERVVVEREDLKKKGKKEVDERVKEIKEKEEKRK